MFKYQWDPFCWTRCTLILLTRLSLWFYIGQLNAESSQWSPNDTDVRRRRSTVSAKSCCWIIQLYCSFNGRRPHVGGGEGAETTAIRQALFHRGGLRWRLRSAT